MLESTNQNLIASREYMGKANQYLSEEDFPQVSEKAWGAAAEMVKSIDHERGRYHSSHRVLYLIVDDLAEEAGGPDTGRAFHLASDLHINRYERLLPPRAVRRGVADVERLIDSWILWLTPADRR